MSRVTAASVLIALSLWTAHAATPSRTSHTSAAADTSGQAAAAHPPATAIAIKAETLLKTSAAWDGSSYEAYPAGKPEVSVLRITIPAHTTMDWHSHPVPNVAYVVSGELTVEKQDGSLTRHFTAGQTVPELVNIAHRGVTGERPVELIVFYAGATGLPLSTQQTNQTPVASAR